MLFIWYTEMDFGEVDVVFGSKDKIWNGEKQLTYSAGQLRRLYCETRIILLTIKTKSSTINQY